MLNPGRFGMHQKVKSAIRGYLEQLRHKSVATEIDEASYPMEDEHDGDWEEVCAVGNTKRTRQGMATAKET